MLERKRLLGRGERIGEEALFREGESVLEKKHLLGRGRAYWRKSTY